MRHKLLLSLIIFAAIFYSAQASAIPVDFSSFDIIDPTVTVLGLTNSSASITEDPFLTPVTLLDFDLPIPADAMSLTFDFELQVGPGNEDFFDFFFGDLSVPSDSFGGFQGIYAGTITKDLTGFAGATLPLSFALMAGFDDVDPITFEPLLDSALTILNAEINAIPEPATLILLGGGLVGLLVMRRKLAK